jgi:hypothetical protein
VRRGARSGASSSGLAEWGRDDFVSADSSDACADRIARIVSDPVLLDHEYVGIKAETGAYRIELASPAVDASMDVEVRDDDVAT